jgi:hypothetical protein
MFCVLSHHYYCKLTEGNKLFEMEYKEGIEVIDRRSCPSEADQKDAKTTLSPDFPSKSVQKSKIMIV